MTPELRDMLDQIDKFLAQKNKDSIRLWEILTGLRGPDNDDHQGKYATTAVIRAKAFPVTGKSNSIHVGATFADVDSSGMVELREKLQDETSGFDHFLLHSKWAFRSLDLTWNDVNEI